MKICSQLKVLDVIRTKIETERNSIAQFAKSEVVKTELENVKDRITVAKYIDSGKIKKMVKIESKIAELKSECETGFKEDATISVNDDLDE